MCKFESKERGRRGTMCKFESKEVCESLCFHTKIGVRGVAKASGVRRCVRGGARAVSARTPSNSGHSFALKFLYA